MYKPEVDDVCATISNRATSHWSMDQSGDIHVVAEGHSTQRIEVGVFVNCGESEVY
jgi:hypothetical protein